MKLVRHTSSKPSKIGACKLLRSSNSCFVCARGVERSIYRGTSVLTGDIGGCFYKTQHQNSLIYCALANRPCLLDLSQPRDWAATRWCFQSLPSETSGLALHSRNSGSPTERVSQIAGHLAMAYVEATRCGFGAFDPARMSTVDFTFLVRDTYTCGARRTCDLYVWRQLVRLPRFSLSLQTSIFLSLLFDIGGFGSVRIDR